MLYDFICKLERQYDFYNKKPCSVNFLLSWIQSLDISVIIDKRVNTGLSFLSPKGRKVIIYNPYLNPDQLILTLGHELGHWLLGHVQNAELLYDPNGLFCTSGIEKDAGIIGFLCWYPTWKLEKVHKQRGYLDPQELAWENSTCDTEWEFLVKAFVARCRIYRAWRNYKKGFDLLTKACRL